MVETFRIVNWRTECCLRNQKFSIIRIMLQRILSGERDRALPDAYFFCSDICDVLFARGFNTEGQGTGDEGKGKRVKGEGRREKRFGVTV